MENASWADHLFSLILEALKGIPTLLDTLLDAAIPKEVCKRNLSPHLTPALYSSVC